MSRFYGSLQGNRSQATRNGSKNSGIHGHIRGWDSGILVECHVNDKNQDVIEAYATSGSNGNPQKSVTGLIFRSIDGRIDYLSTKKKLRESL